VWAEDFDAGGGQAAQVWENFSAHQVYRADPAGIGVAGARWLATLAVGWITRRAPRSLARQCTLAAPVAERASTSDRIGRAIDKRRPAFAEHHLFRLLLGPERELFPGPFRPRRLAPQPACRRAGTDHARPPDGVERDPLHFSCRAYPSRVVRRRLDASGRPGVAGDPPRRRPHPGDRRRTHAEEENLRPAGAAIRRWRRSPATPCRASSSTACRSIWSA
jgi:hypothetical protein